VDPSKVVRHYCSECLTIASKHVNSPMWSWKCWPCWMAKSLHLECYVIGTITWTQKQKKISPILNPVHVGVLHNCCSGMEKLDLYGSKLQSAEIWHCWVLCLQMAYHCWCNWTHISFPQIPTSLRGKLLQSKVKLGTTDLLDKSFMQVGNIDPVTKQLCVCFTSSCQNKFMFPTRWENLVLNCRFIPPI
jgi:hypothetical protein